MRLSRRDFSMIAGSVFVGALLERPALGRVRSAGRRDGDTWFNWKPVGENAWAGIGEGGNSLAVFSAGEWVLVDTKNAGYGDTLRREASELVRERNRLAKVINTHHHADHTGGNYAFAPEVPILAHAKAVERVRGQVERYKERIKGVPAQVAKSDKPGRPMVLAEVERLVEGVDKLGAERFVPTEQVEKDSEIKIGSRRIALRLFGAGHTDNDLVVHLPEMNLIHTGDLLFMGRHPVMDVPAGATTTGWLASLAGLLAMCDAKTVVVPGHGDVTDVNGLRTQVRYFETVRALVQKAIDAGRTRDEVVQLPINEFKEYGSAQGRNGVLGAVFDELKNARK